MALAITEAGRPLFTIFTTSLLVSGWFCWLSPGCATHVNKYTNSKAGNNLVSTGHLLERAEQAALGPKRWAPYHTLAQGFVNGTNRLATGNPPVPATAYRPQPRLRLFCCLFRLSQRH